MADNASDRPASRVVLRYEDSWPHLLAQLAVDRKEALAPSGARDLVASLCDEGSFVEIGTLARRAVRSYDAGDDDQAQASDAVEGTAPHTEIDVPADGLIAGWGTRGGRPLFIAADDVTLGESVRGAAAANKVTRVRDHALAQAVPIVQVYAAQRYPAGLHLGSELARYGYGLDIGWEANALAAVPKVAVVTGAIEAQAALEATWAHLTVLIETASIDVGAGPLRGASAERAGLADAVVADVPAAIALAGAFIDLLPSSPWDDPGAATPGNAAAGATSDDDPSTVVGKIVDAGTQLPLLAGFAPSTATLVARVAGTVAGVAGVAGDVLDAATCVKLARLVRLCDTFRLPLVVIHGDVDLPAGDAVSTSTARDLLAAFAASTVPVVAVALGGARSLNRLGVGVAFDGAWSSSPGRREVPPDAIFAPADTRQIVADVLRTLIVHRPPAWEHALGRPAVEVNLFNRSAD